MNFQPLNSKNPVVRRLSNEWIAISDKSFTQEELSKTIWGNINKDCDESECPVNHSEFNGIEAEILEEGGNWKKGRVRIRMILEFAPEDETQVDGEPISVVEDSNWPSEESL